MHLVVFILKQAELMDDILIHMADHHITGGTILEGTGMAEALVQMEDLPLFGVLRKALAGEEREACKVMLFVAEEKQISEIREAISEVVDLNKQNTGILFALPVTMVEGLGGNKWN